MREWMKRLARACAIVASAPFAGIAMAQYKSSGRDEFFKAFAQMFSLFPGRTGNYLRAGYYRQTLSSCSRDLMMHIFSMFTHPEAAVDESVYIGMHCVIGRVSIGNGTLIGDSVQIPSGRHQHGDSASWNERGESGNLQRIAIGEKSWVGSGAIIMASVGKRCVVGAGAVVTREFPDDTVAVGNPARPLQRPSDPAEAASAR